MGPRTEPAFSAPFNWCDRRCERCVLADTCPVRQHADELRTMPARDVGDTAAILEETAASLQRSLAILRETARKLGVSLGSAAATPPIAIDEARLCRAGRKLMSALGAHVRQQHGAAQPRVEEILSVGMVIASKAARIGSYLHDRRLDLWSLDVAPNLLLMERLRKHMDELLASRAGTAVESTHLAAAREVLAEIDRIVAPLNAGIAPQARALMEALIAHRAAPSPFCILEANRTEARDS